MIAGKNWVVWNFIVMFSVSRFVRKDLVDNQQNIETTMLCIDYSESSS